LSLAWPAASSAAAYRAWAAAARPAVNSTSPRPFSAKARVDRSPVCAHTASDRRSRSLAVTLPEPDQAECGQGPGAFRQSAKIC
jgi:hypothetical protein